MRKMAGRMRRSAAPFKILQFILRKKRAFSLTADLLRHIWTRQQKKEEDLPKNRTACVSIPLLSAMVS